MHRLLAIVMFCAAIGFVSTAHAVTPDPDFSAQVHPYIGAKKNEFLDRIIASGHVPTEEQTEAAWCRAVMWWKMANPDGEQRLTLQVLIEFRQLEVLCNQRMRRATVLPTERQAPPATYAPDDLLHDNDGTRQAYEDYLRWHPEEFKEADTEGEYIDKGLIWWWVLGEGAELHAAIDNPTGIIDLDDPLPGEELSDEEKAFNEAEAAEAERLAREWRAAHANDAMLEETSDASDARNDDTAGLDLWLMVRQPILVGTNAAVGSGARRRDQAVSTVTNALGGALGFGGGGRSRNDEPEVVRCRINDRDMERFENAANDTSLAVLGQRQEDSITIYANIAQSPDSGTFQSALLQNQHGQLLAPSEVRICDLYGEWRLSVSWTRTTYRDGRQTSQESGGWTETGELHLPGQNPGEGDEPDGLWRQLGFSNASHGARQVALTFDLPAEQLLQDGAVFVLHVTRPGQDPVTTSPFALLLEEPAEGVEFSQAP